MRREGRERFLSLGLPTTRDESWRSTNVAPIAKLGARPPLAPAAIDPRAIPAIARGGACAARLVFVDGELRPELSTPPSETGLRVASLAVATAEDWPPARDLLGAADPAAEGAFAALNRAFLDDGALVLVGAGQQIGDPVELVFVAAAGDGATIAHPRVLIALDPGARARVVEIHCAVGDGPYLTNAVTEVTVGEGAELELCRVQLEGPGGYHLSSVTSRQARTSRFRSFQVDLGGRLARHDQRAVLGGEGATCSLDGLYLTGAEQHVDNQTTIDHAAPHCGSRELYKGVLRDRSRAVFNGRIIVRPGAQKTDAKQANRNLLLSDGALAQTRPQLEIYADDVKCTHGATIGRLDADAIFYLRSRGIAEEAARALLIRAFADEVLDRLSVDDLRGRIGAEVAARLRSAAGSTP
jgi:Fe-S cluster assembly protein SufD